MTDSVSLPFPSPAGPPKNGRTPAVGFIFITLLLDVIGLGIIIPVIPKLIQELTGAGLSKAAEYGGWLLFSYAICQFLFSPLVGGTTKDDVKTGRVKRLTDEGFPGRTTLMKAPTVSTLWDYINRAMPWNAPKSLKTSWNAPAKTAPAPAATTTSAPSTAPTAPSAETADAIERLVSERGLAGAVQFLMQQNGWDFRTAASFLASHRKR